MRRNVKPISGTSRHGAGARRAGTTHRRRVAARRKIVFLSVLASYSHTNLAAWYLRAEAEAAGYEWHELEILRSEHMPDILARVAEHNPIFLAATFYLFNRPFLLDLIGRFKALFPNCVVIGGGAEFLGDNRVFLERHPEINAVIRGEGEGVFGRLLRTWDDPQACMRIPGFCGFRSGVYADNGLAQEIATLDDIPSPYSRHLAKFRKPFLLMETARGCANRCAFCTSGNGGVTRYFSLARVRRDLQAIRAGGVREVRVADRTFNEKPDRCRQLLCMFREEFPDLRFHLEIDPARLPAKISAEFARAEPNQLHLELGIQTFNRAVIRRLGRQSCVRRARAGLQALAKIGRLALHVDLLAGLPGGKLSDLFKDLRALARFKPEMIQLECLKILPGTRLAEEPARYGIIAAPKTPYEVLRTTAMSLDDMCSARVLSCLVDWFYNPPQLRAIMIKASRSIPAFWEQLAADHELPARCAQMPSLENRFRMLSRFCEQHGAGQLAHELAFAWLKQGFSTQNGLCPARIWKEPIPDDAVLVEGAADVRRARMVLAELDAAYIFVYASERCAAAIYRLTGK